MIDISNQTPQATHLFAIPAGLHALTELIPTMPEVRLLPLIDGFTTILRPTPGLCRYLRGRLTMKGVVSSK